MEKSTLTCPKCEHKQEGEIPEKSCQAFYKCDGCGEMISPKDGDCCVFCSHADKNCPVCNQK